jgi:hypothetical protein
MYASGARPDLGRGGDKEAATGEDAPLHIGDEASHRASRRSRPGSVAPSAGVTTSAMKLSRAALMVASWSSSLEPNSA